MSAYGYNNPKADDAQADLHKARTINKPSTMQDAIYRERDRELRRGKLRWKAVFYLVILIIILLPFIANYLSYFFRIAFAK